MMGTCGSGGRRRKTSKAAKKRSKKTTRSRRGGVSPEDEKFDVYRKLFTALDDARLELEKYEADLEPSLVADFKKRLADEGEAGAEGNL